MHTRESPRTMQTGSNKEYELWRQEKRGSMRQVTGMGKLLACPQRVVFFFLRASSRLSRCATFFT